MEYEVVYGPGYWSMSVIPLCTRGTHLSERSSVGIGSGLSRCGVVYVCTFPYLKVIIATSSYFPEVGREMHGSIHIVHYIYIYIYILPLIVIYYA